ncbi:cysteine desulfurase/selenocysteine lyase [Saccharothrix ecbatanensis]|uniref:cysteine desulfurase n=1 Tax=Saccharothrix ecbatanensis TaxID=1105145 RepID=A0A7W9M1I2_9PSEU|nr:cysteine desulfurase [Saccharothrix ecbatanensis]MBB5803847.1 cysteine desulfurase/selenocysteine lyase [Saccharothrix ecbatanensis]
MNVESIREDFPILRRRLADDQPLVYLDSANTSQKPWQVIDAIAEHYRCHNANVARTVHQLGEEATAAYELGRTKVAEFVRADTDEIVFTKNASEALNLMANVLAWKSPYQVGAGDEIVITAMEHHSNIVPWQLLAERTGARLRWFGLTDEGRLDLSTMDDLINERTKVVALAHVSNMLGTVNPVARIAERAHQVGALVVLDASQAVPHMRYDVAATGADAIAFTGHKMGGPTGIGVLWGRRDLLAELPPFLGGGEMIESVRLERSTYAQPPHRFEAGTPPIAQAVGLGAAVDYLTSIGMDNVAEHERAVTDYALRGLAGVPGLRILGPATAEDRGGAISFTFQDVHPHDVSQVLDSLGIAVRAGHHCAAPAHQWFGVPATTRASSYLYTTFAEVDALIEGLERVRGFFVR